MGSEPRQHSGPVTRALAAAGHLAIWVGLYFAAAYASAAILLGRAVQLDPLAAAFCAGVGLYLLDRLRARGPRLERVTFEDPVVDPLGALDAGSHHSLSRLEVALAA